MPLLPTHVGHNRAILTLNNKERDSAKKTCVFRLFVPVAALNWAAWSRRGLAPPGHKPLRRDGPFDDSPQPTLKQTTTNTTEGTGSFKHHFRKFYNFSEFSIIPTATQIRLAVILVRQPDLSPRPKGRVDEIFFRTSIFFNILFFQIFQIFQIFPKYFISETFEIRPKS